MNPGCGYLPCVCESRLRFLEPLGRPGRRFFSGGGSPDESSARDLAVWVLSVGLQTIPCL
jgi:hypothetical protein